MSVFSILSLQTYLKDIMKEIGTYNNKGAHKSTWELKPEYRHWHYAEEEYQTVPPVPVTDVGLITWQKKSGDTTTSSGLLHMLGICSVSDVTVFFLLAPVRAAMY